MEVNGVAQYKAKYPEEWFDGAPHVLERGGDFTISVTNFLTGVRKSGRDRGLQVRGHKVSEDRCVVQATRPGDSPAGAAVKGDGTIRFYYWDQAGKFRLSTIDHATAVSIARALASVARRAA